MLRTPLATAKTKALASFAVSRIYLDGRTKPYRPASRNSTVYEYLMPILLAQSSDAPAAGYKRSPDGPTLYVCLSIANMLYCVHGNIFSFYSFALNEDLILNMWLTCAPSLPTRVRS